MSVEVGGIVKGKVTGITKFGVFVQLEDGKTGMVHISEVASTYVKEIRDYVTDNQEVTVKVISIAPDGKISLSMKQAEEGYSAARNQGGAPRRDRGSQRGGASAGAPWQKPQSDPSNFDEMLSRFMQSSDEKIRGMRKNNGERRSSRRGTGGH